MRIVYNPHTYLILWLYHHRLLDPLIQLPLIMGSTLVAKSSTTRIATFMMKPLTSPFMMLPCDIFNMVCSILFASKACS